jgi:PPOX class probable F420-dependent enzyme
MDPEEARRRFAGSRVARLATVGTDGAPHLVPIVFALEGDRIWSAVDHKPKRTTALRRLANVAANPRVAVLADHYDDDDWDTLWWVRADGEARVLRTDDPDAERDRARAVAALIDRYPIYRRQRPAGPAIAIDVLRWTGWSARDREGRGGSSPA